MANLINWVTKIFYKNNTKVFPIEDINDEDINDEDINDEDINDKDIYPENKVNPENKIIDDIVEDFNKISIKPKRIVKFDENKIIIN
jgi:hypothetical protein